MPDPTSSPSIRRAETLTDPELADLAELLIAAVADGASIGWIDPPDPDEAITYWRGTLRPDNHLLLAELPEPAGGRGRVVGAAQLELATRANGRHRAEVNKIVVHPVHQRRGIGRALLAEIERLATDLDRTLLHLDTREGDPSNHLYHAAGWTEAGIIPAWSFGADGRLGATVFYFKLIPARARPRA